MVRVIKATQNREGIPTTTEQAEIAYDKVVESHPTNQSILLYDRK